jgi:predicted nuclease with TOPRIM domain
MGSKEGRGLRKGITNNRNYVYGKNGVKVESTQEEVRMLREKNEEYRKALNVFREKLNEVAIFNSNLAYATRLFTEHTTTKQEKINILRRFDDVESLKESKSLYNSIKNELNNTTQNVVTESVGKIDKSPASGSAQNLIESKTYENPQFMRMKDIMQKINK